MTWRCKVTGFMPPFRSHHKVRSSLGYLVQFWALDEPVAWNNAGLRGPGWISHCRAC